MAKRQTALDLITSVLDTGSWQSWDIPIRPRGLDAAYETELARTRARTGADAAVLTGEGLIRGRRVALLVSEFGFLGGSIGVQEATRIVAALDRATREGLPVLAAPASGGTRMQEGTSAFVHMADICAAVARHKSAGLPYLVHLRHPTTGGVMASWGALGHVTTAEPGALLGFLGPRVHEALMGTAFPPDVQTAENLLAHGLIDAVVTVQRLPSLVSRTLRLLDAPLPANHRPAPHASTAVVDSWEAIRRTRCETRPGLRQLLDRAADVVPLRGTGVGEHDPAVFLGLMRLGATSCVVVGHDRAAEAVTGPAGPAGLRTARRGMRLAEELGLPLLTVIDTAGAALSPAAEQGGLAKEIAACLAELTTLRTPTVSLLLGQGTGGGALALLPADRVLAAQNAWLAPLPPEGASVITHGHTRHAAETSRAQKVGAGHLLAAGTVDRIVPEGLDASETPEAFLTVLLEVLAAELEAAVGAGYDTRRRTARFRTGGTPYPGEERLLATSGCPTPGRAGDPCVD